jgi:hypothetical protein
MTRTQTYELHTGTAASGVTVKGTSPTKALRDLCALQGFVLASQTGRYGRTTGGRAVSALTVDAGRVRYADHGTTRLPGDCASTMQRLHDDTQDGLA